MPRFTRRTIFLAMFCASLGASFARSQDVDVAEAARQARERKAAQQNPGHHVYTEEDLKRAKILTTEDALHASAQKDSAPAPQPAPPEKKEVAIKPVVPPPVSVPIGAQPEISQTESLGEVARRYRAEKAARQVEQATKIAPPSRYPIQLPAISLAAPAPAPLVAPASGSLRSDELRPEPRAELGGALRVPKGNSSSRVSPFMPRAAIAPSVPRPQPSVPLAAIASSIERRRVLPGESWWRIAARYLGKGSRWRELLRVNPGFGNNPDALAAGSYIFVPRVDDARLSKPPDRRVVVRKGDSLWSLAREYLGCASAWPQLAAANPDVTTFTKLQTGTSLSLPAEAALACSARP